MDREKTEVAPGPTGEADRNGKPPFWTRPLVIVLGTLLLAFLAAEGVAHVVQSFTHESTDDAFLETDVLSIAPRIAGQVQQVNVRDNQHVQAGDLLVALDARDAEVLLDQRRAALVGSNSNVEVLKANVELSRRQVDSAEATARESKAQQNSAKAVADKAAADARRARELMQKNTISPQELESAEATAQSSEATWKAAQQKAVSDESKVAEAQAQVSAAQKALERGEAMVRQAELDVKAAELSLSYTRIVAPESGKVTRKAVEPGDYLQMGQRVMALIPDRLWVVANFKETQLRQLRVGQPARIRIDAVGKAVFDGKVDSIQSGSGARFSLLPPENAVGNFVKIVQRVPVKIVFTQPLGVEHVLGPGMSVVPTVRVASTEVPEWVTVLGGIVIALVAGALWWRAAARARAR